MLLSFKIKNFRSFKDEQEISFILNKNDHIDPERRFEVNTKNGKVSILKNAVIYGANASGKTNILLALQTLSRIIMNPTSNDNERLLLESFAFNRDNTRFEIEFLRENIIFKYHLEYNYEEIVHERLHKDGAMIFKRDYQEFVFPDLDVAVENLLKTVRCTGLLLFFAQNYNVKDAKDAFSWFFDFFHTSSEKVIELLKFDKHFKEKVLYALQFADFNILDIEIEEGQHEHGASYAVNARNEIVSLSKEAMAIYFIHENNGEKFRMSFRNESEGTKIYFGIILSLLNPEKVYGSCIFIDELDLSLHKQLTSSLLRLLNSQNNNIQLISTSHDSSLMDLLKPHQIYFVEKNVEGESKIFKLSEFDDISNDDKYASEYEDGLYGADQIINDAGLMSILGGYDE